MNKLHQPFKAHGHAGPDNPYQHRPHESHLALPHLQMVEQV